MVLRGFILVGVVLCSFPAAAPAQLHKVFPWFHRAEPEIDRQVYVGRPGIRIGGGRIGILPFVIEQQGPPDPPPFGSFLRNALLFIARPKSVVEVADPALTLPEAERGRLGDEGRIALSLDAAKQAGVEILATGQIDAVFRTASGGMVIKVRAQLWDVESRAQVWSGRVALNWIRRYSLEDCLLRAGLTLVEEWKAAAGADGGAGLSALWELRVISIGDGG